MLTWPHPIPSSAFSEGGGGPWEFGMLAPGRRLRRVLDVAAETCDLSAKPKPQSQVIRQSSFQFPVW